MQRWEAIIPLAGIVGCTLLTDIPDDASSGGPDHGASGSVDGGKNDAASDRDATVASTDSGNTSGDPGGPPSGKVTLDAVGPGNEGAGGKDKTSPLVWSHTTSGANRALFVSVTIDADPDNTVGVGAVKYEGVALTLLGTQHANNKDSGYTTLWAMANPAAGAHPVSVEFTGAPAVILAGSISFQGVDQTTPFRNVVQVGGTGNKAQASVASAAQNMVVASLVSACAITPPNGAQGWLRNVTCSNGGGNAAQSTLAGAQAVDVTYGIDADWWGIIAADVNAATP